MNKCIEVYETCGDCHKIGYCELVQMDKKTQIEISGYETVDNVIKPSHYKSGKFDVIAFCQEHDLNFDVGNVIKYCTRAGKKEGNSELQDLNKAMEFLRRRIEFVESKGE